MIEQDVLEAGGEMDLCSAHLWEAVEEIFGECRRAVLHRTGKAAGASQLAELLKHREVECDLSDAAAWERHTAVARAGLYRNFAQTTRSGAAAGEGDIEFVEVGGKLFGGGVLMPDLADLTTHADLNAGRLQLTNEGDRLGGANGIHALLLWHRWQGEVYECGGVDIDVAIPSVNGESAGTCDLGGNPFRIGGVLLGHELVVVTLNEDWPAPAGGNGTTEDARGVVGGALEGVGLLGACQLKDECCAIHGGGGLQRSASHLKDLAAQVQRRNGKALIGAVGSCRIERRDAGALDSCGDSCGTCQPLRRSHSRLVGREGGGPSDRGGAAIAQLLRIKDFDRACRRNAQ